METNKNGISIEEMEKEVPRVTPGTIARTIILALALVNQILLQFGKPIINFNSAEITELVANLWTIIASVLAWWKNNSFTGPARIADLLMHVLKLQKKQDKEQEND